MIGATLTHYRITTKLGEGGMGEVYRATDTKLGREVAIKVLPASFNRDPQSLVRFEREAKALAALNHPHIAGIYGLGADQGTHFLVLELVEGETLAERLRRGPLPIQEALAVARQMAEAIQEAHEKGVIHRDLKPGNVKITPSGRVKVLDFGLAKMEQSIRGQTGETVLSESQAEVVTIFAETTLPGAVMGTPAYMSPEQARGQEVDKRTDIWAFACCLFECLSGRKPFCGQTASDLMAEVLKSDPDWSQVPAETPREVVTLLRRCLEKQPSRRLSSIGDIAIMLDESTRGPADSSPPQLLQSPITPPSPPSSAGSSARRRWPVAAGLLLLIIGAGVFFLHRSSSDRNSPSGSAASPTTQTDKSVAVLAFANLSDDKGNEYFSDGVSEELLNVLAKVPGLKVSARTSAFHFKGKDTPIPEIARQLGVAYVVEGSVRKADKRVRITAQLIKTGDGFHVWSDTFTRDLKDIFAVQDEIAGIIAKNLSLKLGVTSSAAAVVDPEVLQLYFQGRQLWSLRSDEALDRMEALMKRALELDARFAPAEAGLAQVWVTRAFIRSVAARHLETELTQAEAHANRAIELDPTSAEAFEALGTAALDRGDLVRSETALKQAVALNPNYAPGWNKYGWLLERRGHLEAALEKCSRARELDPLVWPMLDNKGWALLQTRRYAEAAQLFAQSRALPISAPVTWANGGIALMLGGRNDQAVVLARSVTQGAVKGIWNRGLRDWSDGLAAWVLAEVGAPEEARLVVERLTSGPEEQRYTAGPALVALGRDEEGCAALAGLPQHLVSYLWLLVQRHETLAVNPHFQQLLAQLDAVADFQVARETLARLPKDPAPEK